MKYYSAQVPDHIADDVHMFFDTGIADSEIEEIEIGRRKTK